MNKQKQKSFSSLQKPFTTFGINNTVSQHNNQRKSSSSNNNSNIPFWGALASITTLAAGLYLYDSQESEKNHETENAFEAALNRYLEKYYGNLKLPKGIIEQLAMFQTNAIKTPESNVRIMQKEEENSIHIEIKRSLARWNCLRLLLSGKEEAYQAFVAHQPEADKLSYATYQKLSRLLTQQSAAAKQALEASCFIAMSEPAKKLAIEKKAHFSLDSEKFLSDTIAQCPEINPIFSLLNSAAQKLLPYTYLPDSHGRHMLYTEGGDNMFAVLREKHASTEITREQEQVWFGRWLINIAGFRGHEDAHGSIYLTENTAEAVLLLNSELAKLKENPEYDVLKAYLEKRAKQLGVQSLYLAHLGCSLRLYTKNEGQALQAWFDQASVEGQIQLEQNYEQFRSQLKTTPTYEVAVMDNLLSLGCSIAETLNIYTRLSTQATRAYTKAIAENSIDSKTPLCYRDLAFKNNLVPVLEAYRKTGMLPELAVDKQGNVIKVALEPELNLEVRPALKS